MSDELPKPSPGDPARSGALHVAVLPSVRRLAVGAIRQNAQDGTVGDWNAVSISSRPRGRPAAGTLTSWMASKRVVRVTLTMSFAPGREADFFAKRRQKRRSAHLEVVVAGQKAGDGVEAAIVGEGHFWAAAPRTSTAAPI